jgi:hypothetical protein
MADLTPEIIFGGGSLGARSLADAEEVFAVLQKHRVKAIDTAYVYVCNLVKTSCA